MTTEQQIEIQLPTNAKRKLIYHADNQGYYKTPFLFATNCNWPKSQLEQLSWEPLGAGRISTSFETFQKLLKKNGYICDLIKQYPDGEEPKTEYDLIRGATGNY